MPTLDLGQVRPVARGQWTDADNYSAYDWVTHTGSAWLALQDVPANYEPGSHPEFWTLFGAKGDKGDKGTTGPMGPQGPAGANGRDGKDGAQGPQGVQGLQGPVGPQGPKGEQGPQGPAVPLSNSVSSTSQTDAASSLAVKVAYDKAVEAAARSFYELCEFYFFRHPTLRPGFQPAQGGLLEKAATLYPDAWAYLQTTEGKKLCRTEAEWQALTRSTWATLADGTTVGWNGIGGAPFYAPNTATGALRLPDLRGMYAEAAGFDALGVGGTHGDGMRNFVSWWTSGDVTAHDGIVSNQGGNMGKGATRLTYEDYSYLQIYPPSAGAGNTNLSRRYERGIELNASLAVPTAPVNRPRAWGALACCYLGVPR